MRRLVSVLVAHPASCVMVVVAITLAFATQIPKLKVNVSPHMLMIGSDPAVAYYEATLERFGSDEITIIAVKADDVFTTAVLESVDRLSTEVRKIDEVTRVDSLTTVDDIRGEEDWVSTRPLVPGDMPNTPAELEDIRKSALRNPVLVGNVVAPDSRTTAVVIYSEGDPDDPQFNKRFSDQIDAVIAAERERSGLDMYQIGKPYRQALLAKTLIEDQEIIWPLGALIITVVVVFMLRSPIAVLILMTARLTCVVWAVGLMGLLDFPVTMLSGLIPLLLLSIGFTEDVYVVAEYYNCLAHERDKRAAIRATMLELGTPLLVTSLTTAVGFASLALSDVTVLKQVGYLAPLAFVGSFLVTLLLVPALLYYAPVPRRQAAEQGASQFSQRLTEWLIGIGRAAVNNRRRTLLAAAGVFLFFASGFPRLRVDNDILGFFRKDSEIRQRAVDIHERLAGALIFYLVVDTHREGGALEPKTLAAVEGLQQFASRTEGIDKTFAVTDFLKTINREMHGGDQKFFTLPDSKEMAAQYLVLLHEDDTEKYIDSSYTAANVVVRHDITSTRKTAVFIEELDRYAREHMPGLDVHATAETILTTRAANVLSVNMLQDLGITIVIVGIVCSLFFMSIRAGLLSLIPNVLPVAIGFGTLGLFGVPINVGTALIAAIAIGIAIDDTVHYMARNSMELDRHHDPMIAMTETVRAEGPAIVTTAFALAGGFLVLVQSSFMPLVHFGAVSAVTMLIALVADLTITPALMASTRLVTLWNVVGTKLRGDICEIAPLFKGLTRWEAKKVVLLGKLRSFDPESYVIRQGDLSDRAMYIVLTGKVRVMDSSDGAGKLLRHHGSGEIFGEMALIDGRERSADVIAEESTEILTLRSEDLDRVAKRFPRTALKLFQNLSGVLSDRVRSLTVALMGSGPQR